MKKKIFSDILSVCCLFIVFPIFLVWLCNFLNPYDRMTDVLSILGFSILFFVACSLAALCLIWGISRKIHGIKKIFSVFDVVFVAFMILILVFPVSHTLLDGQQPAPVPVLTTIKQFAVLLAVFSFAIWFYKKRTVQFMYVRNMLGVFSVIFICYSTYEMHTEYVKIQNSKENVSSSVAVGKANVFLLVVETLQGSYFEELYKKSPELFAEFTGATLYTHAVTGVNWSPFSTNQIFTGNDNWHTFEKRSSAIEALKKNSLISDAESNSFYFTGGSYVPVQGFSLNPYGQHHDFFVELPRLTILFTKYYCAGIRRLVPAVLWRKINKFENKVFLRNLMASQYPLKIAARDTFKVLTDGLEYKKDARTFFYNFNYMTHREILFDRNGNSLPGLPQNKESQIEEYRYVLKLYSDFIRKLKQLDIYDSSLIIMTGDHGAYDMPYGSYNPMIIVKPPFENQPLTVSDNTVLLTDIRQLIKSFMNGMGDFEKAYKDFLAIKKKREFKVYIPPSSDYDNGTKYAPFTIYGNIDTVYEQLPEIEKKIRN